MQRRHYLIQLIRIIPRFPQPKFLSSYLSKPKKMSSCFSFLYAALEVSFIIHVRLQSNEAVDVLLTPDDRKCLEILHLHNVNSHKLVKLIDQSINQADAIIQEYAKYTESGHPKRMPAQLAKAFLNGVFTAAVTHLNDRDQRYSQIPFQRR
jgi:hypothetical protein